MSDPKLGDYWRITQESLNSVPRLDEKFYYGKIKSAMDKGEKSICFDMGSQYQTNNKLSAENLMKWARDQNLKARLVQHEVENRLTDSITPHWAVDITW